MPSIKKRAAMILTAEQQWMVAMVYEKAAANTMDVPAPQRAAFARKAQRFRLLARVAAKIEKTAVVKPATPLKPRQTSATIDGWASNLQCAPQAKYRTLAEKLEKARVARDLPNRATTPGPYCLS